MVEIFAMLHFRPQIINRTTLATECELLLLNICDYNNSLSKLNLYNSTYINVKNIRSHTTFFIFCFAMQVSATSKYSFLYVFLNLCEDKQIHARENIPLRTFTSFYTPIEVCISGSKSR